MNTLTPQELGLYIGQEIKVEALNGAYTIGVLSQINTYGSIEILCEKYGVSSWTIEKCEVVQLLLRPLSSITEEERNKSYDIFFKNHKGIEYQVFAIAQRINYLRSIGIDCDNLIEQGKAIDKTKLKD